MKTGFYQHGAVAAAAVAEAIAAADVAVAFRNAHYFNERETEKFDVVVVDEGSNTAAITGAYTAAAIQVWSEADFLEALDDGSFVESASAAPKEGSSAAPEKTGNNAFNPDAPRGDRKPGKKQGAAAPEKTGE